MQKGLFFSLGQLVSLPVLAEGDGTGSYLN